MLAQGGRVTNYELVKFRRWLTDPVLKEQARLQFKDIVNNLATIKQENGEKYLRTQEEVLPPTNSTSTRSSILTIRNTGTRTHLTTQEWRWWTLPCWTRLCRASACTPAARQNAPILITVVPTIAMANNSPMVTQQVLTIILLNLATSYPSDGPRDNQYSHDGRQSSRTWL